MDILEKTIGNVSENTACWNEVESAIESYGVDVPEGTPKSEYAEKVDAVFEAGIRAMWEAIQNGGKRGSYSNLLAYTAFTKETYKPIYDIKLTGANAYNWQANYSFSMLSAENQVNMKEVEEEQGMRHDFSGSTNIANAFSHGLFSVLNVIDISQATNTKFAFYGGYFNGGPNEELKLRRIERLICSSITVFESSTFQYASMLEYIGFEGEIAQNGLNLQWSNLLCKDSIVALINTLSSATSGLTVTLSREAVHSAFEPDEGVGGGVYTEEWEALAATKPNWTISLV